MIREILLITNYFPPEKGAASNRMFSLAEALSMNGYKVGVVCPLPNYPSGQIFKGFKGKLFAKENTSYAKISRLWIWPSNSANKIVRLFSMVSFSVSLVLFFFFKKTPKKIFIQYSPVFIGFTAVCLGKLFQKKIILNVSDLWPMAGLEMGILNKGLYYSILLKMEKFCYRNAHLVIGQSEEIITHITDLEKDKPCFIYRNLPNFPVPTIEEEIEKKEIKIVYAGLLGIAQGLAHICRNIDFPEHISLHIYGAGPEAEQLKQLANDKIVFHGELNREALHQVLQQYDIAFIPLMNRIYGSVPSKIFEYTRLGLPVLYFAGGEGGDIVKKADLGWVIPVNDFEALQVFLNNFLISDLKQYPKQSVQQNSITAFDFNRQFKKLMKIIEVI